MKKLFIIALMALALSACSKNPEAKPETKRVMMLLYSSCEGVRTTTVSAGMWNTRVDVTCQETMPKKK